MNAVNFVKTAVWIAFLTGVSAAGIKYIAIVEGDIDEGSGASEHISRADVRLVTAEIRREAVKNLPPKKYVIMTSETVIAQGGAALEECADENCVIKLGNVIGADYIVRGVLSKLESRFTLQVEMYETNDGTLVASCDPVRSESIGPLVEKAGEACANMFKAWLAAQTDAEPAAKKAGGISAGGGAFFAGGFGGGIKWPDGEAVAMPYTAGGGAYLFLNTTYAEVSVGVSMGGGTWISAAAQSEDDLPYMSRTYINIGVLGKYPMGEGRVKYFPLLGLDYEAGIGGKLEYNNSVYEFDGAGGRYAASALSALWVKFGGGGDFKISESLYLRGELLYGVRMANFFETDGATFDNKSDGAPMLGSGVTGRIGAGFHF